VRGWALAGTALALAAWALLATRWPPHVLPGPARVLATAWAMRTTLADAATATGTRVLAGYGLAIATAIPLAALLGALPHAGRQVDALLSLLRGIPPFAWTPLLLLWLGVGDASAVTVVFLGAFFPIVRQTRAGIEATPPALVDAARNLGASEATVALRVRLPAALPLAFAGLRLGWTLAWMSVVAAELVGADRGLGQLVLDARNLARPDVALAGMATIGAVAAASEHALAAIERRALRWRA
jgi:ABC-type nitrate/sulfonate/bicarbonate transport system permease component